jgi:hypothetical protein
LIFIFTETHSSEFALSFRDIEHRLLSNAGTTEMLGALGEGVNDFTL